MLNRTSPVLISVSPVYGFSWATLLRTTERTPVQTGTHPMPDQHAHCIASPLEVYTFCCNTCKAGDPLRQPGRPAKMPSTKEEEVSID